MKVICQSLAPVVRSAGARALRTRDFIGLLVTEDSQCRSCAVVLVLARVGFLFGLSSKESSPASSSWLRGIGIRVGALSHRRGVVFWRRHLGVDVTD